MLLSAHRASGSIELTPVSVSSYVTDERVFSLSICVVDVIETMLKLMQCGDQVGCVHLLVFENLAIFLRDLGNSV